MGSLIYNTDGSRDQFDSMYIMAHSILSVVLEVKTAHCKVGALGEIYLCKNSSVRDMQT